MKSYAKIAVAAALLSTTGLAHALTTLPNPEQALSDYLNAASLSYDTTFEYDAYRATSADEGIIENLTAHKTGTVDFKKIAAYFNINDEIVVDLPEISYDIAVDYGDIAVSGLMDTGAGLSYDDWTHQETIKISATIDTADFTASLVSEMKGVSAQNGLAPIPERLAEDPGRPVGSLVDWLASMSAGTAGIVSMESGTMSLSAETDDGITLGFSYEIYDLDIENLVNGMAGNLRIAEARHEMVVTNDYGDVISETITDQGTMLAENYSLMGGLELFVRDTDPYTPKTLIGQSTTYGYRSVQFEDDMMLELSVSKMDVEDMTALPTGETIIEAVDYLITTDDTEVAPVLTSVFELYQGMSFGLLSSEGIEVRIQDFDTDTSTVITVAEAEIADVSSQGIGRMRAAGIEMTGLPDDTTAEIGNVALKNVEFADAEPLIELFEEMSGDDIHHLRVSPTLVLSRVLPPSATLEIDGVRVSGEENFGLDYFRTEVETENTAVPTLVLVTTRGLEFNTGLLGHEGQFLQALGIETIAHENDLNLYWNEATEELELQNLMIEIRDLGMIEANLVLGGVPKAVLEDPQSNSMSLLATANIIGGKMSFTDMGGIDRLIDAHPELGGSRAAAQKLAENHIKARFSMFGPDFVNQASQAVGDMMNGAERITVEIAPNRPVPLMQIVGNATGAPHTVMKHLGARIYAH